MDESRIIDLLKQTKRIKGVADELEDSEILGINYDVWDILLTKLEIEDDYDVRNAYYEMFAKCELGMISEKEVITWLKEVKHLDFSNE